MRSSGRLETRTTVVAVPACPAQQPCSGNPCRTSAKPAGTPNVAQVPDAATRAFTMCECPCIRTCQTEHSAEGCVVKTRVGGGFAGDCGAASRGLIPLPPFALPQPSTIVAGSGGVPGAWRCRLTRKGHWLRAHWFTCTRPLMPLVFHNDVRRSTQYAQWARAGLFGGVFPAI